VLRTVNDQPTLWDAILPAELLVLPVELGDLGQRADEPQQPNHESQPNHGLPHARPGLVDQMMSGSSVGAPWIHLHRKNSGESLPSAC
jgi:hypothetical protein